MNIRIYVAGYHPGNPSDYLCSAFERLQHTATIVKDLHIAPADLHVLVDSGAPFPLSFIHSMKNEPRVCFWCIDFRHNKSRPERDPNDWEVVNALSESSHTIFQAQWEDYEACKACGLRNIEWLPLAADPNIWHPSPSPEKRFDLAFVGNIFDETRAQIIQNLLAHPSLKFAYGGPTRERKGVWKEEAAQILSASRIGFNVNSFFGTSYCYDVNMRFFETLATGTPLVTNYVPSLDRLFQTPPPFIRTFQAENEIVPLITGALQDEDFLASGSDARQWILKNATYEHRAMKMLQSFFPGMTTNLLY